MKLSFRTITEADIPVAQEILGAAFGFNGNNISFVLKLQPSDWLFALADDVPVGMGGATHYDTFSFIGMMAVLPSMQGHGIGRAVMDALLQRVKERGCPNVLLDASKAGAPLYLRLGFVEDDQVVFLQRKHTTLRTPPPHGDTISPLQESDFPDLAAFDLSHFGAARTNVLAAYLASGPQRAFVARDTYSSITGFLIAQAGSLGPWMATNAEAAEQLLHHALTTLPFENLPHAIIPALNTSGQQLLQRYGFEQDRVLAHMRLGPPVPGRDRRSIYGQASFAIS